MDSMPDQRPVVVGVDTHKDFHTVAVTDLIGTVLETATFAATTAGYRQLLSWCSSHGTVTGAGVEGTGSWGKGLTRYLTAQQVPVVEVNRPNRQLRRRRGKSDVTDAVSAARAVLNGDAQAEPRHSSDGPAEALRVLRVARRSAVNQRSAVINQIQALINTAPEAIRTQLESHPIAVICDIAARYRPTDPTNPTHATKLALRSLAQRHQRLSEEITHLSGHTTTVTAATAPAELLDIVGVGPITAADLLITAGANPERITNEAAFAALTGVSPVDASSGQQLRHRLNRGGDRQANAALHRIVIVRLRHHPPSRDYMTRRLQQGRTKKEIIRCLKRYAAREVYHALQNTT